MCPFLIKSFNYFFQFIILSENICLAHSCKFNVTDEMQ